jgi:hypothetical protein
MILRILVFYCIVVKKEESENVFVQIVSCLIVVLSTLTYALTTSVQVLDSPMMGHTRSSGMS